MILRDKIFFSVLLALNCQLFIPLMYSSNDQDIYPFKNDPNAPWREFEKDFRIRYKHLNIPPIQIIQSNKRLNDSSAGYVDKHATHHQEWLDLKAELATTAQPPFIVVNQQLVTSSDLMGWTLLHEIGHHYYQDNTQLNRSRIKANIINASTKLSLLGENCAYFYRNILNQPLIPEQIMVQALLVFLLRFNQKALNPLINNFMVSRPEEYFADNFANQLATVEMLKAAQHDFSVQGWIEQNMRQEALSNNWAEMSPKEQQQYKHFITSICSFSYSLCDKIDIESHPSDKKRHDLIKKALKDRFGITK